MAETQSGPDRETLLDIYRRAMLIHRSDERFRALLTQGKLAIVYYPVRGQEVVSAAMMAALNQDDYLVTTYRGVADQLAKGIPSKLLWAEFTGRVTGTCKGKGGPMHITHPETGVMVTTGVVGSGLPIANGLGIASQNRGDGKVTVVCFGDGASNIGAFHEAMNMAQLYKLPVIFLCSNNKFGEHTAFAAHTDSESIVSRAAGYGMRGVQCDGNDAVDMYNTAKAAVDRARAGEGPTLIEAMTFRMLGHLFGADFSYVPKEVAEQGVREDPIPRFRQHLLDLQVSESELDAIVAGIEAEIDEAVAFALESPFPEVDELRIDVVKEEIAA
ncbi:thiamine pyrophosphate-dependent dehydrogenase E1 component subunit alpha [Sphingomonas radiodurans]|uniref:thiamine pyrophosphate-dependent dehydrogenase E1 component subunit alpha n=1 Tax=Sphingomonas radiodurans TaxID=2890321 RepID=UPI001E4D09FB|nr:thiamine pyrophosphate-dependent dehydrogenase E1 component subunit alpha [Sphingomonas radiodurans]WBH17779.1 thiamine pyrophosphate-dependent dehydrogenase E1 component subunit alpha [Sphingomonas radiodurans]